MSDDLAHTLADILGVLPLEFNPKRSLLKDKFDITRKRIVDDKFDYDTQLKAKE